MLKVALFAAGFVLCSAPGFAAAEIDLAGKVLYIDSNNGRLSMYLLKGGSFETFSIKGPAGSGVWRLADGALCATYTIPEPPPQLKQEHCMPIAGRNVGDTWTTMASRNGPIRYTLAAGAPPAQGAVRTWM